MKKTRKILIFSLIAAIVVIVVVTFNFKRQTPTPELTMLPPDSENAKVEKLLSPDCSLVYDKNNVSFNYPCLWKISRESKDGVSVSSPNNFITFTYPAESFSEYENEQKKYIQEKQVSVKEIQQSYNGKTYPVREYSQHGGVYYLIKLNAENYAGIWSDFYIQPKEKKALDIIVGSLKVR